MGLILSPFTDDINRISGFINFHQFAVLHCMTMVSENPLDTELTDKLRALSFVNCNAFCVAGRVLRERPVRVEWEEQVED